MEIINNVLPEKSFLSLRSYLESNKDKFQAYDVGGTNVHYLALPKRIHREILSSVATYKGKPVTDILSFARLNTPALNTEFRIHSDGIIFGQKPNLAGILYLREDGSGTATFKHPEYGSKWNYKKGPNVHLEDDGLWEETERVYAKENTMALYDAQQWHGRFPWKVEQDRIVVVLFMKI